MEPYRAFLRHQLLTGAEQIVSVLAFWKKANKFPTRLALWCVGAGVQNTPDWGNSSLLSSGGQEAGLPLPELQPDSPQMTGLG